MTHQFGQLGKLNFAWRFFVRRRGCAACRLQVAAISARMQSTSLAPAGCRTSQNQKAKEKEEPTRAHVSTLPHVTHEQVKGDFCNCELQVRCHSVAWLNQQAIQLCAKQTTLLLSSSKNHIKRAIGYDLLCSRVTLVCMPQVGRRRILLVWPNRQAKHKIETKMLRQTYAPTTSYFSPFLLPFRLSLVPVN